MLFREACIADIPQLMRVRLSVKENALPDPGLIPAAAYEDYLMNRGKGWVCEEAGVIAGFAVADLQQHNIWALFVQPEQEGRGIGKRLHDLMLHWYFSQTGQTVWLGTEPQSKAEGFYRKNGWTETGRQPNGEIRFEMTYDSWKKISVPIF